MYEPQKTALLFDLDGTLLDKGDKIALDVQAAFALLGTRRSIEEARSSENWEHTAAKFGYSAAQFWDAFEKTREPWEESLRKGKAQLYDDTLPALDSLVSAGYTNLGLVTRSSSEETKVKLSHFGLDKYFKTVKVTSPKKKEFPNKALAVMDALMELQPLAGSDILLVGDSEQDDMGTAYDLCEEIPSLKGVYVNRTSTLLKDYVADYEITKLTELMGILRGGYHGCPG